MNRITMLLMVVILIPLTIHAEEGSMKMELENIAEEYAACAAYYRLVYHGMVASDRQDLAINFRQLEDDAMLYSLLLANEGRDNDMAVQVTNARIELSMKVMKKEIDNRNENIAIINNKYADACIAMSKEPPPAAQKVLLKRLEDVAAEEKQ